MSRWRDTGDEMALHALRPASEVDLAIITCGIFGSKVEKGASGIFTRFEAAKDVADLARRTQVDHAEVPAGEQAGVLLHLYR